jgi:hypothetical protein
MRTKMKKSPISIFFILIYTALCGIAHAQDTGAYLVPRRIFIGDPAILVLPLPGLSSSANSSSRGQSSYEIVLTPLSPDFPLHANIDFHKITLERHPGGSRLIIDFTAFAPGILELPVIEIGGERFSGLTVTVNSIIDSRSSVELSMPASSLAMPGTALMLYGTMTAIIIFILLAIWFVFKGRVLLQKFSEKWKLWRLFISIKITEKRLHRAVLKGANKRLIINKLSDETRVFLSILSGYNCRAMTAREFMELPFDNLKIKENDLLFLPNFFRRCDKLRFSGVFIISDEVLQLLADLHGFVVMLEKARKEKPMQKEVIAA